jgi:hypothetical protein
MTGSAPLVAGCGHDSKSKDRCQTKARFTSYRSSHAVRLTPSPLNSLPLSHSLLSHPLTSQSKPDKKDFKLV